MPEQQPSEELIPDEVLYQLLLETGSVPQASLDVAAQRAKEEHTSLYEAILWHDFVSDEKLCRLAADFLQMPFVLLAGIAIEEDVLRTIPEVVAKKNAIIVFRKDTDGLHIATKQPDNVQIIDFIRRKTGMSVTVYLSMSQDIANALLLYGKNITKAFDDIIHESLLDAKGSSSDQNALPIIKIVDNILSYAYQNKSSDVHIEPREEGSLVRFRIDGILHDIVTLPLEIHPQIVSRIKVLAKLRTDEHQAPHDGKIRFESEGEALDIRVSVVPVTEGEKIVMRLLSERSRQFSLSNLGFGSSDLAKVNEAYNKPYGTILVTGPTGCGKTTTLYSILKLLNNRKVNIMTIEDPVEYDMEGVNQIQVNTKANLTFATGLRSILRQDPNIILVGEIRDKETAGIAINLAMTGHLVLSTLHTNDSATAVPRMIDMDIEPFLLSSTINVIVAQRLVRKIHDACRVSEEVSIEDLNQRLGAALVHEVFGDASESGKSVRLYRGKGCDLCHQTGYQGRIGVFEVMTIDDKLRTAITNRKDAATIADIAIASGMTTMLEDGLEKVKQGITTLDEVLRVIK
ncbi:MAG: ATPase, T2SS/T4P/T4SS family [Candidatus Moranbacteria bacterium]|nr:ATPase, T2SS/T4P/T4SS family [Candidatus Moranbacteria bacterium]